MVKLTDINKQFNNLEVLKDINLMINKGEIISLIGPSGSGKTTLLKILCGLEKQSSGTIEFSDNQISKPAAVMVFQEYFLFPHMTIFDNVAFGLKNRALDKITIKKKVTRYLEYFGIADKASKYPNQLSAGQMQRTAIARAMIIEPALLLLDEPFANLDKNLKVETAEFIRDIQKQLGTTTINVTHDQEEAFVMSDKIGILIDGELIQYDLIKEIYYNPANQRAAEFLGPVNSIPSTLFSDFNIQSQKSRVLVRAESFLVTHNHNSEITISKVCFVGSMIQLFVNYKGVDLKIYSFNGNFQEKERISIAITHYF